MMTVNQKNIKPGQQDDFLRIQDLLYLCLARWKWFVLSLAVTIGAATAYLLRTPAVYTRTASVLIKEDSKGKSVSSDLESFSEFVYNTAALLQLLMFWSSFRAWQRGDRDVVHALAKLEMRSVGLRPPPLRNA